MISTLLSVFSSVVGVVKAPGFSGDVFECLTSALNFTLDYLWDCLELQYIFLFSSYVFIRPVIMGYTYPLLQYVCLWFQWNILVATMQALVLMERFVFFPWSCYSASGPLADGVTSIGEGGLSSPTSLSSTPCHLQSQGCRQRSPFGSAKYKLKRLGDRV